MPNKPTPERCQELAIALLHLYAPESATRISVNASPEKVEVKIADATGRWRSVSPRQPATKRFETAGSRFIQSVLFPAPSNSGIRTTISLRHTKSRLSAHECIRLDALLQEAARNAGKEARDLLKTLRDLKTAL